MLGFAEHAQRPQLLVQVLHDRRRPGAGWRRSSGRPAPGPWGAWRRTGSGRTSAGPPAGRTWVLSTRKYSCSGPTWATTRLVSVSPNSRRIRMAWRLTSSMDRSKRRLFVQGLAAVGAEDGGDAEGALLDKGKGGGVPSGVAPGLKGGPQAAGGEGGGIRLAPNQILAGKFQDHPAALGRGDEAVVLFRRDAGHGLEPVGVVGAAPLHRPRLHGPGDLIGGGRFQRRSVGDATSSTPDRTRRTAAPSWCPH